VLRVHATSVPRILHRAYAGAAGVVRSDPVIYRVLFGHWPAREVQGQLWDWTTLALAAALRKQVQPGASLLDMGTGPAGVLAIYAKVQLHCGRVFGVDHLPELLPTARATAARCGAAVEFAPSALFSSAQGRFDFIVFNAPYIPVGEGRHLGALRQSVDEKRWSGGVSGLETIERFLGEAPNHLTASGRIVLGVNHFYLAPDAVRRTFVTAGLEQLGVTRHRLTQACAYLLRPAAVSKGPHKEYAAGDQGREPD
jgi:methylase of polypeptide subunit release factors